MNVDLKVLWAKLGNYVDPILAGIIVLLVLNLAGGGLAYYANSLEVTQHPLKPVVPNTDTGTYTRYFTDTPKNTDLPETYANLTGVNFFKPAATRPEINIGNKGGTEVIIPPDGNNEPPPPPVAKPIEGVTYHGSVYLADGGGVAQLSSAEAENRIFMVRVGGRIPGTDIELLKINPYYALLRRPGYQETKVPIKGAVQIGPGTGGR